MISYKTKASMQAALIRLHGIFLNGAIGDYNKLFNVSYDTSADKFPNYYKDVSLRMKNREIDLLIVVKMFLTGFDATTLNTLWVDKNLEYHGLIQAFSPYQSYFELSKIIWKHCLL